MTSSPKLVEGDKLPDTDHVLRYIRKRFVDLEDQIAGDACAVLLKRMMVLL
jgi:hypothetical protein